MITEEPAAAKSPQKSGEALHGLKGKQSPFVATDESPLQGASCSAVRSDYDEMESTVTNRLPPNVDPEVFSLLPRDIQEELLSNFFPSTSGSSAGHIGAPQSPHSYIDSHNMTDIPEAESKLESSDSVTTGNQQTLVDMSALSGEGRPSLPQSSDYDFPGHVDPKVFSELPPDVQKELISEWKQQKLVLKSVSSLKAGRSLKVKEKKAVGRNSQANNLFKYFKHS